MSQISKGRKLIAIHSGGDWYDASVRFLEVPKELDEDAVKKKWRERPEEQHSGPGYISLEKFIEKELGGAETDAIECWWDD